MTDPQMTAHVVHFSQTGNTERVAEAAGRGLAAAGAAARVTPMLETDPAEAGAADLLAVAAPVFYYREPTLVRDFIARLPDGGGRPALTLITHGGNPVNTLRRMQKQLARRGRRVLDSFACTGYDTYPMFFRMFREWGHPDGGELEAAETFGERSVEAARQAMAGAPISEPRYPFVGGKYFILSLVCRGPMMKRMFPALEVREDVCTRCGACARTCPTGAITLEPYPKVSDACMWCYQCERICPEQAFACDWSKLRERMGV